MSNPFRIMTFDGGGIRGVLSARILQNLTWGRQPLLDSVDLFAGTSTGGIISLALAAGLSPQEVVNIYRDRAGEVFMRPWSRWLLSPLGLTQSKYTNEGLIKVCRDVFGSLKLGELKRNVVIPTFDLRDESGRDPTWRAKFFHNLPGDDSDGNELVADVAVRTASAPVYFPVYQGYVDGGLVANNPAVCAVAAVLDPRCGLHKKLSDLRVLSIGTGADVRYLKTQWGSWGILSWLPQIVSAFMDGAAGVVDFQVQQFLQDRYRRISPVTPDIAMDDIGAINQLLAIADGTPLGDIARWLEQTYTPNSGVTTSTWDADLEVA